MLCQTRPRSPRPRPAGKLPALSECAHAHPPTRLGATQSRAAGGQLCPGVPYTTPRAREAWGLERGGRKHRFLWTGRAGAHESTWGVRITHGGVWARRLWGGGTGSGRQARGGPHEPGRARQPPRNQQPPCPGTLEGPLRGNTKQGQPLSARAVRPSLPPQPAGAAQVSARGRPPERRSPASPAHTATGATTPRSVRTLGTGRGRRAAWPVRAARCGPTLPMHRSGTRRGSCPGRDFCPRTASTEGGGGRVRTPRGAGWVRGPGSVWSSQTLLPRLPVGNLTQDSQGPPSRGATLHPCPRACPW